MNRRIPVSQAVVAVAPASGSLGDVAGNLNSAAGAFTNIFSDIFCIIGVMLVCAALIKFKDHRVNPQETTLTRVLVLLISGLVIGFAPWMMSHLGNHVAVYSV